MRRIEGGERVREPSRGARRRGGREGEEGG